MDEFQKREPDILAGDIEVDSNVNEDENRERQLDASLEDWYRKNIKQKEDITNVPEENVFEVAENIDAEGK